MTDDYHGWRELLAQRSFLIHENAPLCGFWRQRTRNGGPFERVAIWRQNDGKLVATRNGTAVEPSEIWTWVARYPITEEEYRHHEKHGVWPGEVVAAIGHNRPADPYQALCEDVEASIADGVAWLAANTVADQRTADIVGNKVSAIRELASKAESAHGIEKEPHLKAGRAVDAKYKPLVKRLDEIAAALKRAVAQWAAAEQARLAEERRKAEAERARIEAENRRRAEEAAKSALPPTEPIKAPALPEVKVQAGGGVGRKLGFKTVKRVLVVDYVKTWRKYKDREEVRALIAKLAQQDYDEHKVIPPGCEVKEEVKAA